MVGFLPQLRSEDERWQGVMREILFRGKIKESGEWVDGDLVRIKDGDKVGWYIYGKSEVIPETVGQFTGLTDKNGKRIFEGDIVDVEYDINYIGVAAERIGAFEVVYNDGCFMKCNKRGLYHFIPSDKCKVIGNVYDNPDLMMGGV